MWFIRAMAVSEDGTKNVSIISPLVSLSLHDYQMIYPTVFFAWFRNCPKYNVLADIPTISLEGDGDEMLGKVFGIENLDKLKKNYVEKETQERITSA